MGKMQAVVTPLFCFLCHHHNNWSCTLFLFIPAGYRCGIGNWIMRYTFTNYHGQGGIALCPSGDIAVSSDYKGVAIYDSMGKQSMKLACGQKAEDVVVNKEGTKFFVTTRTPLVIVFDGKDGEVQFKFAAIAPDGTPSDTVEVNSLFIPYLSGLAMDRNGHLFVGAAYGKYISKHRQDGKHLGSIKVKLTPRFLAITQQDTIVLSTGQLRDMFISEKVFRLGDVQVVDQEGNCLHSIEPPASVPHWCPQNIACSKDTIFVTYNNPDTYGRVGVIYVFSLTGQYLGCILNNMEDMVSVAVTEDGNRLIAQTEANGVCVLIRK